LCTVSKHVGFIKSYETCITIFNYINKNIQLWTLRIRFNKTTYNIILKAYVIELVLEKNRNRLGSFEGV